MTPLTRAPDVRLGEPKIDLAETAERPAVRAYNPDELVILFSGEIWRFAHAQVSRREDAEDIVMEVFGAAFRDFNQLRRVENQRHWLLGIARKKVADTYRKQYRRAEQPLSEIDVPISDMPSPTQIAAREALASLPEGQREALTLKYVNGLTTEEVGRVTRRSAAATNSLLQRGREALRQAMDTVF